MQPTHPKYRNIEPVKIIGEHSFYLCTQADEILHTRYMVAEVQELYIRAGISQEFLSGISQLLIDRAFEINDIKKLKEDVVAIAQNLKGRLGFVADMTMYEELACVLFLMDDEPFEYLPEWQERKKEVWKKERDFFLLEAFNRVNQSGSILMKDIIAVFQAASERISQLPTLTD